MLPDLFLLLHPLDACLLRRWWRAVCRLLTPDYKCFGFNQTDCMAGLVQGAPLDTWVNVVQKELLPLYARLGMFLLVAFAGALCFARRAGGQPTQSTLEKIL